MAAGQGRSVNQKLKLLYLKKFFEEETDADHPATMQDILDYLKENGIKAERKSIYTDLSALQDYGMDVRNKEDEEGRVKTYKLLDRDFQLPEIKLIIDSIASSRFLSEKRSNDLIEHLGSLVSKHQRKELNRQVCVMGRPKSMNKYILYNADAIYRAITDDTTITFKYFHYNARHEREYARNGELYEVSPWALLYDNDNYYLYCSFSPNRFYTYRVDRMAEVAQTANKRQGKEEFDKANMAEFSKSTFGMFSGKQEKVSMVIENKLIDVMIDKFGKDVWMTKEDKDHVMVMANVSVSPQFFAWVFGLGSAITITHPESVVKQMKDMLSEISKKYE